jgi:hypothetical protein
MVANNPVYVHVNRDLRHTIANSSGLDQILKHKRRAGKPACWWGISNSHKVVTQNTLKLRT